MLKKLDETLPLAETSSLANADLAGRFYLASRGALECGGLTPLCVSLSCSRWQPHCPAGRGSKERQSQSGVKPPHSKGRRPNPGGRCRPFALRQRG